MYIAVVPLWGLRWRSWLMFCTTSRNVSGSIPDGVIAIFYWHNPSRPTVALGSIWLLTGISTGIFPGGKGGRCVELTTLPSSCAYCLDVWEHLPPGTFRACPGLQWDWFTFTLFVCITVGFGSRSEPVWSYKLWIKMEVKYSIVFILKTYSKVFYSVHSLWHQTHL